MNISELIVELKFHIAEHAMDRAKALNNIQSVAFTYNEHIMKMLLYGNLSTDWKDEVFNHLFRISKYKLKNSKRIPKSVIERNLILDYVENYSEFFDFINGIYETLVQRNNYDEINIEYYTLYNRYIQFNKEVLDLIDSNDFNYINYIDKVKILTGE